MSQLRYDPVSGEYVLIAPERLHRPEGFGARGKKASTTRRCPFCEGHESLTPSEIFALRRDESAPDGPGWRTRVVPNLFKAVQIEAPWKRVEEGMFHRWEGFGAHEVIIDTPRHLGHMAEMTAREIFDWLYTFRLRLNDLRNDVRLLFFSLFKNQGLSAGATQPHPHSQLIALPAVPRRLESDLLRARDFWQSHGASLFDEALEEELEKGVRVIARKGAFVAYAPYGSQGAFEVRVQTRGAHMSLCDIGETELHDLGGLLHPLLGAMRKVLGDFDFNLFFNTPPLRHAPQTEAYYDLMPSFWRMTLTIRPRIYHHGGFEHHSGIIINPVAPEEAARHIKEAWPEGV